MTEKPSPRWRIRPGHHSPHQNDHPELYTFLGPVDNLDVYVDLEELIIQPNSRSGEVVVNSEDAFARLLLNGDEMPKDVTGSHLITFDQMCIIMQILEEFETTRNIPRGVG